MVGDEILGVFMMFHSRPGYFSTDHVDLIRAATNQIAISINNAELYYLVREQAEELGSLLHKQEVETTRSRAILESIAEGVIVTDSENKITHFNAAGEEILQLQRAKVLGKSLAGVASVKILIATPDPIPAPQEPKKPHHPPGIFEPLLIASFKSS